MKDINKGGGGVREERVSETDNVINNRSCVKKEVEEVRERGNMKKKILLEIE